MVNKLPGNAHFDRCPRCGAVILFKPDSDTTVCDKCKAKIRMKT